nr:immunoglobulin light chain junction region [Macaca mulatta]MPO01497.1 immunoglobulin light chain junction region [Macaca mulatta]
CYQHSSGWTC